jgi:hypothetical protein
MIAAHFKFELRGHARFAAGSGNAARAVGSTARDLAHRREILKRVGQPHNNHAVMEQSAIKGGDRSLLAAVLTGGAAKNTADLADQGLPSVHFDFTLARAGSVDAAAGRVSADPTKLSHG